MIKVKLSTIYNLMVISKKVNDKLDESQVKILSKIANIND